MDAYNFNSYDPVISNCHSDSGNEPVIILTGDSGKISMQWALWRRR